MSPRRKEKPLLRSLGEFFGEVWKGIAADPTKGGSRVVSRRVEQHRCETDHGDVILRRTTIDEVIIPGDAERPAKHGHRQA